MNDEQLWSIVGPLIKKKYSSPDYTSIDQYKKYYEAACIVGMMSDKRFPTRWYEPRKYIEDKQFSDKQMWKQGNRQSLTYRSNRVEKNFSYILKSFHQSEICNYLWEVQSSWENVGWILARSRDGAEQIAQMMYSPIIKKNSLTIRGGQMPVFDGDQGVFTEAMNDTVLKVRNSIKRNQEKINELNESIESLHTKLEFLTLNMMAFNESEPT